MVLFGAAVGSGEAVGEGEIARRRWGFRTMQPVLLAVGGRGVLFWVMAKGRLEGEGLGEGGELAGVVVEAVAAAQDGVFDVLDPVGEAETRGEEGAIGVDERAWILAVEGAGTVGQDGVDVGEGGVVIEVREGGCTFRRRARSTPSGGRS